MPEHNSKSDPYIELSDGSRFYMEHPETYVWNPEAIAHSLSNQCRYTGHCRHFYSVAEHSVLVSLLAEELGQGNPFEALMHDAHESVISDLASPWKPLIPAFKKAEIVCETALRNFYGLPAELSADVKRLDWLALFVEAYYLMPGKGEGWMDPLGLRPDALRLIQRGHWKLAGLEPGQAKTAFLRRYSELRQKK